MVTIEPAALGLAARRLRAQGDELTPADPPAVDTGESSAASADYLDALVARVRTLGQGLDDLGTRLRAVVTAVRDLDGDVGSAFDAALAEQW